MKIRKIREGTLLAAELLLFVMAYCEHEITVTAQLKKKTTLVYSVTLVVNEGFYKKKFFIVTVIFFQKSRFFKVEKLSFPQKKNRRICLKKNSFVHELAIVSKNIPSKFQIDRCSG